MEKRVDIKTGFHCNNNCLFCVQAHKKKFGNRTTEEIKKDLTAAKESGCEEVVFTGGEVTIRDDLLELISFAKTNDTGNKHMIKLRIIRNIKVCIHVVFIVLSSL